MSIIAPTLAETSSRRQGGMKGEKESATYDGVWHDSQTHSPKGTTLQCRPDFWSTHDSILFRPSSGSLQQVPAPPPLRGGRLGLGRVWARKKWGWYSTHSSSPSFFLEWTSHILRTTHTPNTVWCMCRHSDRRKTCQE